MVDRISVVLPVYSETETVREIVGWLKHNLGSRLEEIVIIISPKSQKPSYDVCAALTREDPRVRMFEQQRNPGLGHAVREGLAHAKGEVILCMDSDGEMDIETVPRLVAEMERGNFDMVVASRWAKGGGFSKYNRFKYVLNWGFQQIFRVLYRTRIHDLTYGFKLIRARFVRGVPWQGTLHEIACETTLRPLRMGARTSEVPTRWTARVEGQSKNTFMRNFRYVGMALRVLFQRPALQASGPTLIEG
ncbi:MAG TPA: glycosyltransferase family 2 protein [Polyangia bacterium]|nr:glycosyltransferase family 2 protein [Polyangia bacterium]